jgi:hypothetical protein
MHKQTFERQIGILGLLAMACVFTSCKKPVERLIPLDGEVTFGNEQLTLTVTGDGTLAGINNEKGPLELHRMNVNKPAFTVTLIENAYGLDTGKRRVVKLRPVTQEGNKITLAPQEEALPTFTFRTIDKDSYFVLELLSMENPANEYAYELTMENIRGGNWMPLDSVTSKSWHPKRNNPRFFGVLRRSESNPLGSIAMWYPENEEEDDEILYQVWAHESMPHPKVDGEWTVARAKQWIADYIEMRKEYASTMFIGPRKPEDLKLLADEAKRFGLKSVYMHLNTWGDRYWATDRDNFEVNEKMFPGGRKDMAAFGQYLKDNGMKLTFRTVSYALGQKHPQYVGKAPDDRLAYWWKGSLAKDTDAEAKEIVVAEGREHTTWYDKDQPTSYINKACMQIGNELVAFGSYVDNGDGTWTLKDCHRGLYDTDAISHKAGEKARGLYRSYGLAFAPDPDSTLLDEMAKRFAEFHLDVNAGHASFDALEAHIMMFPYGTTKFMGEIYRHIDRPVDSGTSGGEQTWGFIEPLFHAVQNALDPTRKERPHTIPQGELKIALHKSYWNASSPYAYVYGVPQKSVAGLANHVSEQAGFHDLTLETINGHGLMDHYAKVFKQWNELGFGVPQNIKERIYSTWYKNPFSPNFRYSLVDEVFRFEGDGDDLCVVPFRVMKRKGVDRGWTVHQEHGTIYPYQYIRPGQEAIRVNNPYHSQVPEFIIRVMPDFSRDIASMKLTAKGETADEKAFYDMLDKFQGASGVTLEEEAAEDLSGKKISYRIMPDPATVQEQGNMTFVAEGGGVRITSSNDSDKKLERVRTRGASLPFYGVKSDITKAGGLGMVVTGDGSGAILVVRISGQGTRDYIVHLDFTGKRYVEIPSPQASWADDRWPFTDDYKRWRGNSISKISLGIDRVKPNSTASVLLENLRFLPEKASALVNPSINVGTGGITINGTVPSDRYLWYQGGDKVGVYDLNWNKLEDLPVTLANAAAASGDVDLSVTNHKEDGSPWLEVQFFVKDRGMPVKP